MEAASLFFYPDENRSLPKDLPEKFEEYLIVIDTGWTLDYIRNGLSYSDFNIYASLARMRQASDIMFKQTTLKIQAATPRLF